MSEDPKRRGLGRGLSALLGEEETPAPGPASVRQVPIERIHPGRFQPRRKFDEESMQALADSIAAQGILQPLLVRHHPNRPEEYELLAGERRWRAAQRARLHEVPVMVRDLADREALEVALVENVQRQDLSALEEAAGYQRLIKEFGHTQEDLARAVGKSRSHIANTIRLLSLPDEVHELLEAGRIAAGHARALLGALDPIKLARDAARFEFSVRQVEHLVQAQHEFAAAKEKANALSPSAAAPLDPADANIAAMEKDLSLILGLPVEIELDANGRSGSITIRFSELDQFDEISQRLMQKVRRQ
ncbi:MAG TPA: ParB/RepB/Spo0J family partition protein [Stellaceae bacterium]|nr:ParB/RepB/Spo0J family partition protein [Stellaceae bacterium]